MRYILIVLLVGLALLTYPFLKVSLRCFIFFGYNAIKLMRDNVLVASVWKKEVEKIYEYL